MTRARLIASAAPVALISILWAASAQAEAPAPSADTAPHTVDEIVVTAQKRTQNLQDVPIVVTTVNGATLRANGVKDIKDLTILTPGLTVTSTTSSTSTTARVRGVGTVGDNIGLESSVGIVIDGVYRPRNGVGFGDLGELERVEVLKGPQGTLFGKNATAGVINVITKRPEFSFGAEGEANVGNYNLKAVSAGVTGPIIDGKVAGRLFVSKRERDGFVDVVTGAGPRSFSTDNNQNYWTARGQLLFTPTDALDINVSVDYTKRDERCCTSLQVINGGVTKIMAAAFPGSVANPPAFDDYKAYANRDTRKNITDKGVSAEVSYDLGAVQLTSITAYREFQTHSGAESDLSTADIIWSDQNWVGTGFKTFSQEFRLAGSTDKLHWTAGTFFTHEDLTSKVGTLYGADFEKFVSLLLSGGTNGSLISALSGNPAGTTFANGQGQRDQYNQSEQSFAVFGNASYQLTSKLELTGGLRYTWENKGVDAFYGNTDGGKGCATFSAKALPASLINAVCQTYQNPAFNNLTASQDMSEGALTGTVKAAYRFNPQVMTYASYARGYKAGGFNLDRLAYTYVAGSATSLKPITKTDFAKESADSYEVGVKSTLFDRRLLLNATMFYQKYTDFQLNAYNGLAFTVISIPEVTSKGVDADFVFFPVRGLTLQGGVTYAETEYSKKDRTILGATSRLPESRLSFAPLWSASTAVSYEHDLTEALVGKASVSAKYTSAYNTGSDLNPLKTQQAFTLWNARLSVGPQDDKWAVELWGQNLTDERYYQVAYDATYQSGSIGAFPSAPRTFGATFRVKY
ncbi:TonB-dependent receptor [Phenylobacterium aquaticum]|uniref:TonB-dependent receptor n=1 Tax=Phenylobacterium aquaticum TaxID=1763816 RepID=UPI0026F2F687|nr:TonB-dependent receptor [Phenylobacterium aquaticum]